MTIEWQTGPEASFGSTLLHAGHELDRSPRFDDAALAALLDDYPRDQLGIWTFADHGEGEEAPVRGEAPHLSGAELLEAVRSGRIWLNLRAVNQHVERYGRVADEIFDSLQAAGKRRVFKRDMGVLISSPRVNVHYHLDIPLVALFQVRGEKTVWFYPPTHDFAPDEKLEAIVLKEQEEGLAFRNEFEDAATRVQLKPGMAVTWPQTMPHRVQNGDMMNVSLSCEFMTAPALVRANALYANARLRRQFGLHPRRPVGVDAMTVGKAALARLIKAADRRQVDQTPTPPTFIVDPSAPGCTRHRNASESV